MACWIFLFIFAALVALILAALVVAMQLPELPLDDDVD